MGLFDIIPENFFSILSSKNKYIYVEALFSLRKAYETETFLLKKDLVVYLISDLESLLSTYEIETSEGQETEKTVSFMIHLIIRRLIDCQWIDEEYMPDSFETYINIPNYAVRILNIIYELANPEVKEYNSYVYSTYSLLRTSIHEGKEYFIALEGAYKNTEALRNELKSLLNNIRRYHQLLLDEKRVEGILQDHFEFYETISEKIYYPIKTFDSFSRYKSPIIKILKHWINDQNIKHEMVMDAIRRNRYKTEIDASDAILDMIVAIIDRYEGIHLLLEEIDKKNAKYTRASAEKIQYLLNSDGSIKGKLIDILKNSSLDESLKDQKLTDLMQQAILIYPQENLMEDSLFKPRRKKNKIKKNPLPLPDNIPLLGLEDEIGSIVEKAHESFSSAKVMDYMIAQFRDQNVFKSTEFFFDTDHDFMLAVLGTIYYDDRLSFYNINLEEGNVYINGYRFPNVTYLRKDHL